MPFEAFLNEEERMLTQLQYITNEQGEQVGVVLDIKTYQQLTNQLPPDPDILVGLSQAELEALAESVLAPPAQTRLDLLLSQNAENRLSAEEVAELDRLLTHIDYLNILKTRTRYTLSQQKGKINVV